MGGPSALRDKNVEPIRSSKDHQSMSANKMLKMPRGRPVLGPNEPALLHSRRPCPNSCGACQLKTPPSSPRANRSELQKAARPSQSSRSKSPGTTIVPDDSASQVDPDDTDDFEQKGGFRWLISAGKFLVLKSLLPLGNFDVWNPLGKI